MRGRSLLRMLLALCAALALVVSPAFGFVGTLPGSEDGAPSMQQSFKEILAKSGVPLD